MAADSLSSGEVSVISPDDLFHYRTDPDSGLNWDCLFMLPVWLQTWWTAFGKDLRPHVCAVSMGEKVIGVAPLVIDSGTARLMGDSNLSDFVDFIISPGYEKDFFRLLFRHLKDNGIRHIDAGHVRTGSTVFSTLVSMADDVNCMVEAEPADPFCELSLPKTWDDYLALLDRKQRREILRKLRRVEEAGRITFRVIEESDKTDAAMDTFIKLFSLNRRDKALFMSSQMEFFFRLLVSSMAEAHLLRLFILEIGEAPAAAAICFDYRSSVYLYNNGYDKQYAALSVAQICKILSIKDSIERGRSTYNFLKGGEPYKKRLGGIPSTLYKCYVTLY